MKSILEWLDDNLGGVLTAFLAVGFFVLIVLAVKAENARGNQRRADCEARGGQWAVTGTMPVSHNTKDTSWTSQEPVYNCVGPDGKLR